MEKLLTMLIILLLLTACGSAAPTLNPTEGAHMLAGDYTTTITTEDIENFKSLDDLTANQGIWILSLGDGGEFVATLDGREIAQGNYTVTGDRIEVYISNVVEDNGCLRAIGRFVWSLQDNELRLAKIAGMCDGMDLILTSHVLLRQP
jgi:hypothetical protein